MNQCKVHVNVVLNKVYKDYRLAISYYTTVGVHLHITHKITLKKYRRIKDIYDQGGGGSEERGS